MKLSTPLLGVLVTTGLAACAPAEDSSAASQQDVSASFDSALVGSWSIDDGTIDSLQVGHKPFRTVASLILRADGSYFAQLAPREVLSDPLLDESQMAQVGANGLELVGAWRGASGRWTTRRTGAQRELVLTRDGDPERIDAKLAQPIPLMLTYELSARSLSITNAAYAGTQKGRTDVLVRRNGDCRTASLVRTQRELDADKLAAEAFDYGRPVHEPGPMQVGSEGEVQPAGWCHEKIIESGLRGTRTNHRKEVVATVHGFSDLTTQTSSSQSYVYDATGALRVVVTTSANEDITGGGRADSLDDRTRHGSAVLQTRTYFDEKGAPSRSLVQPHIEEAIVAPGESIYVGRRYESIHLPTDIVDMPWCVSAKTPEFIAANPNDPKASLAAAPVCRASL